MLFLPQAEIQDVLIGQDQKDEGGLARIFSLSRKYQREAAFKTFIDRLIENPGDQGWNELLIAVRQFSDAHPDAIDLYETLIESPEIMAGLLIRTKKNEVELFLEWQDYLPFRWWQIPIKALSDALTGYQSFVRDQHEQHANILMNNAIEQVTRLADLVPDLK